MSRGKKTTPSCTWSGLVRSAPKRSFCSRTLELRSSGRWPLIVCRSRRGAGCRRGNSPARRRRTARCRPACRTPRNCRRPSGRAAAPAQRRRGEDVELVLVLDDVVHGDLRTEARPRTGGPAARRARGRAAEARSGRHGPAPRTATRTGATITSRRKCARRTSRQRAGSMSRCDGPLRHLRRIGAQIAVHALPDDLRHRAARHASTGVPHAIASIRTRPNGSSQWIGKRAPGRGRAGRSWWRSRPRRRTGPAAVDVRGHVALPVVPERSAGSSPAIFSGSPSAARPRWRGACP